MKIRYFLLSFFWCCCLPIIGEAQFNTIKIDGVSAVSGRISIGYERTFGKVVSFHVGVESGTYAKGTVNGERDYTLYGKILRFELRAYPFCKMRQAPNGFFIGEGFSYSNYSERYEDVFGGYSRPFTLDNSILKTIYILTGYKYNYKKFSIEGTLGYGLMDQASYNKYREQIPIAYRDFLTESGNGFIDEKGMLRLKIFFGYTFPRLKQQKSKKEDNYTPTKEIPRYR